ncbi:MAG: hypothetical protein A4E72_01776 [Syntrophus sp. PtaU1.Bin208]|nr:MAG: hypothetical protein A4E72_01776 [Syntrophus sp. PtaU1.Bin208]
MLENLTHTDPQSATQEARQSLSLIYKRANQWDRAVNLWEGLLKENPGNLFAAEELAKWHEHRTRDIESAFALVDNILRTLPQLSKEEKEAWLHRHARLQGCREKKHFPRNSGK